MVTDTRCLLDASNYAATEQQVSQARRWVRETAANRVDDETLYDLSLCASELVDNARKHGPEDGVITVAIYLTVETVRLEVTDDTLGATVPHVTDNFETVDGHGLMIVSAIAERWGKYINRDKYQVVWCEFPRSDRELCPLQG
jgi:anti-sigma regulatory factor (Ser/Thr protein kinase)